MDMKLYLLWKEKEKVEETYRDEKLTGEERDDTLLIINTKIYDRLDHLFKDIDYEPRPSSDRFEVYPSTREEEIALENFLDNNSYDWEFRLEEEV